MTVQWLTLLYFRGLDDLEKELGLYPDDAAVWTTVPGVTNSAGTLTLHLCGNLQHFIGAKLGGSGYVRSREHEFAVRGVPRAELKAEIARTRQAVAATMAVLSEAALQEVSPDVPNGIRLPTGLFLMHLSTHLAHHIGQIGYLRRVVTGNPASAGAVGFGGFAPAVMP